VVDEPTLCVVGAAHGVEVVLFVVIQRRLVAEPAEHGVGVRVDVDVVRVVVDVGGLVHGHGCPPEACASSMGKLSRARMPGVYARVVAGLIEYSGMRRGPSWRATRSSRRASCEPRHK